MAQADAPRHHAEPIDDSIELMPPARLFVLNWPMPALLVWLLAWGAFLLAGTVGWPAWSGVLLACVASVAGSRVGSTRSRRLIVLAGFPVSLLLSGWSAALPAWAWLFPLAALLALYPVGMWRDAPVFPTPHGALQGLRSQLVLRPAARVLDAGCGLGDGLRELHAEYPDVLLEGLEMSWPLRWLCELRCRYHGVPVRLKRADMWAADWSPYDMVYVFQRPDTVAPVLSKAFAQMRPGAWVVSLAFDAPDRAPTAVHHGPGGEVVWLYQVPRMGDSGSPLAIQPEVTASVA